MFKPELADEDETLTPKDDPNDGYWLLRIYSTSTPNMKNYRVSDKQKQEVIAEFLPKKNSVTINGFLTPDGYEVYRLINNVISISFKPYNQSEKPDTGDQERPRPLPPPGKAF